MHHQSLVVLLRLLLVMLLFLVHHREVSSPLAVHGLPFLSPWPCLATTTHPCTPRPALKPRQASRGGAGGVVADWGAVLREYGWGVCPFSEFQKPRRQPAAALTG
ncbi:hypothetical protein FN846DRAFT_1022995 [Sphaerosporella brunnea]|uniref:Secreted protein n=1 Tax=Sphaerosporella brunnea TaxID=1250544 RepID=A0A5J5EQI8_9PEZI|nr:hypothetical protein FN846DRAFT_1022995 [Sphaerosporella brunnea]